MAAALNLKNAAGGIMSNHKVSNQMVTLSKGLQGIAKRLDKDIERKAGEKIGFTLVIYTEGRAQYVSTVDRQSSIEQMEYLISLWKQDMPDIEAHKVT